MKLYYANLLSAKGLEKYLDYKLNILAAFPSFPKAGVERPPFCDSLFVDSGAFGKNSSKVTIAKYIQFLYDNKQKIDLYANLDAIGNAKKTLENQRILEEAGLSPLPVFHYGSDEKYLHYYLERGYDYISLGGMVPISSSQLCLWLDRIWANYLTHKNGTPKVKIHGFGLQIPSLIKRYPWYSVDASSVHVLARYGGILTPWGAVKINPNVNSKEVAYQIKTPQKFNKIKDFVNKHCPKNTTFEDAKKQDTKGIYIRCAISINYLQEWISKEVCSRFQYTSKSLFKKEELKNCRSMIRG